MSTFAGEEADMFNAIESGHCILCMCSGNEELKRKYGLTIVGPKADKDRIPGIDLALGEGDTFDFGQLQLQGARLLFG